MPLVLQRLVDRSKAGGESATDRANSRRVVHQVPAKVGRSRAPCDRANNSQIGGRADPVISCLICPRRRVPPPHRNRPQKYRLFCWLVSMHRCNISNNNNNNFAFAGPAAWNSLPDVVRSAESIDTFKRRLFIFCLIPWPFILSYCMFCLFLVLICVTGPCNVLRHVTARYKLSFYYYYYYYYLRVAQLMPLPLTVSCFSKIQIGFTFLVPAHPGSPRKGPLNGCVCVSLHALCFQKHLWHSLS